MYFLGSMSPLAQLVLASMLHILKPGLSPYSLVPLKSCDAECQKTPACQTASDLACRRPWWDKHHKSYVRQEGYSEGLLRYATIAKVAAALSVSMAWEKVEGCKPHGKTDDYECKLLRRARPWTGNSAELRRVLLTTLFRESGFRRDIHSGIGPMARGDCNVDDKGNRIPHTCQSHCLAQILIDRRKGTVVEGHMPDDLVGLDPDATGRCLTASIRELSHVRSFCAASRRSRAIHMPTCIFMSYVGTANPKDGRVRARLSTYHKLAKAPKKLKDSDKLILGLPVEKKEASDWPEVSYQPRFASVAGPGLLRQPLFGPVAQSWESAGMACRRSRVRAPLGPPLCFS